MSDASIIELRDVRKSYGSRLVLDGVSLDVGPGVTGLLGPNGSGKSTLIKSLMGLVAIDSGEGQVLGHRWPQDARAIRDVIGYLPEDDCYIAGLQGVESVQLAGRLSGLPANEALRRAHEVMDFCDVGQERYRLVETYSTGMRQKLKFAQTLVHDPRFIILDEPTTGLDPGQRDGLLNRISLLARKHGKTVLLSTHILTDVRHVCDSVIILVGGRVRVAERLEVLSRPSEPGMHVTITEGRDAFLRHLQTAGVNFSELTRGELYLAGIEPESSGRVWELARQAGASVGRLAPAQASLEQIFMEAVKVSGQEPEAMLGGGDMTAFSGAGVVSDGSIDERHLGETEHADH